MLFLIKNIFIPSSICFILLLLGVFFIFLKKEKRGFCFILIGLSFYYLFSITPGADFFLAPLESDFNELSISDINKAEIIVVLSGGEKTDLIRSSEVFRISNLKNHQPIVIISGTEELSSKNRTSQIEKFFINRGIPAENIIVEDKSRNTKENAREVVKQVKKEPFFLITSAYHMRRAVNEFENLNSNPIPAPVDFRVKNYHYSLEDYIPNSNNLRKTDLAFYEYLGIIYYNIFD
jgi:uncharacterized SAM-binding protein YcdF (DUF218 family)